MLVLLLSARAGAYTVQTGPRPLVTAGSLVCAAGVLFALRAGPGAWYLTDVLPAVALTGSASRW